eukprot:TRINITY_DN19019_c0_g5_i1.p1 TRINITY_DN19019_c0_g5~~TRINITY_DN19019_c0_g5_i1.p1  ORF type:complete len:111 (-),score=11.74 TRINITY_DN19019_c0_g5_i1:1945-2277(-)
MYPKSQAMQNIMADLLDAPSTMSLEWCGNDRHILFSSLLPQIMTGTEHKFSYRPEQHLQREFHLKHFHICMSSNEKQKESMDNILPFFPKISKLRLIGDSQCALNSFDNL